MPELPVTSSTIESLREFFDFCANLSNALASSIDVLNTEDAFKSLFCNEPNAIVLGVVSLKAQWIDKLIRSPIDKGIEVLAVNTPEWILT